MGRDSEAVCLDCKQRHYLGYGSCLTWFDQARTIAEWESQASTQPGAATLHKNLLFRKFLEAHADHDFLTFSSDWCSVRDSKLTIDYDDRVLADLAGFAFIDEYTPILTSQLS